ncbi:MAG TPA: hypothetical protein VNE38_14825 [Ktedonobacteraceae bacterium]|nr:hypothetical protein [Ktedonobacteraceae bacterium]
MPVTLGEGTGVDVLVAVGEGVLVAVGEGVLVTVGEGVLVAVGEGVLVAVGEGVLVAVGEGVLVTVGEGVLVTVGEGVLVTVGEGVLVPVVVSSGESAFSFLLAALLFATLAWAGVVKKIMHNKDIQARTNISMPVMYWSMVGRVLCSFFVVRILYLHAGAR